MDVFAIRCAAMRVGVVAGALLIAACTPAAPASQATQPPNATQTTAASVLAQEYRSRPLQIPVLAQGQRCPSSTPRPVTERFGPAIGDGPVYAAGFEANGTLSYTPDGFGVGEWDGQKVLWVVEPRYTGPAMIRGGRIDAPGDLRFDDDKPLASAIDIAAADASETPYWRDRPSYTRFQSAGCYAYQVDGPDFSYTVVFEARESKG